MSGPDAPETDDELGPIDLFAVAFPGGQVSGNGFAELLGLAERGVIRILDAEFLTKAQDGRLGPVSPAELSAGAGVDLSAWEGASSGLLDRSDLAELDSQLTPGDVAAVVVFENRWVLGLIDAWRADGARLIFDGGVAADDLLAALDATESTESNQ